MIPKAVVGQNSSDLNQMKKDKFTHLRRERNAVDHLCITEYKVILFYLNAHLPFNFSIGSDLFQN